MPMPARCASALTVSTNHSSVLVDGASMTRAPVDHFAIGLLISSEKIAPVNPTTSENTIKVPRLRPLAVSDITNSTARLVARNRTIRFIQRPLKLEAPLR